MSLVSHVCKSCASIFNVDPEDELPYELVADIPGLGRVLKESLICQSCGHGEFVCFITPKLLKERRVLRQLRNNFDDDLDKLMSVEYINQLGEDFKLSSKQYYELKVFLERRTEYTDQFTKLNDEMSKRFEQPLPKKTNVEKRAEEVRRNFNSR